ncbi:MAG: 4Fe-4S binding protein, partial [Gammaproteobacteria bacterium]
MTDVFSNARNRALSTLGEFSPQATSLISYQSNGRVFVFGPESAVNLCHDFTSPLSLVRIPVSSESSDFTAAKVFSMDRRQILIEGYLGKFVAQLVDNQGASETLQVDIVVDLNPEPLIKHEIPPPGYLHRSADEQNIGALEDELLDLVGEFEKPKYFNYNPDICAHGVNGATYCTNCIDACPAGAISGLGDKIEVIPFLCQGGGTCATVCPSGAIQYAYPGLADSGNQIHKMLTTYLEQGGEQPVVVFHTEQTLPDSLSHQQESLLPVRVEELAAVGMDLCLSTLAYGAAQVVLLANDNVPELSLEKLTQHLNWVKVILTGLGLNPLRVSIQNDLSDFIPYRPESTLEAAIYTMPDSKRNSIYQALDHLYQQSGTKNEVVDLPGGAPFGAVTIDESSCTLCLACVGACPGKALQDGSNRELPEVFFIESNCIQCGVCVETCPEQSISLTPRMVFDRETRIRSRVLNQDTPFACISCGKPFAPTSAIHRIAEKLKDHYMFQTSRARDRLKMCEDCRVVDIVQDPDALKGN